MHKEEEDGIAWMIDVGAETHECIIVQCINFPSFFPLLDSVYYT